MKKTAAYTTKAPPVSEFMSRALLVLESDTNLADAAVFFSAHKLTTVPVIGPEGEILGVLSDFHLLRALIRCKQEGKSLSTTISKFQDEFDPVFKIEENDSIVHAFKLMLQSPNHRIYAVNGKKLVGALSPKDLLLFMAGGKGQAEMPADPNMVKQMEAILKELHDTKKLLSNYKTMFEEAPYLMHSLDMNGKIIAANRMLHFVLGYRDGELIGKTIKILYPRENLRAAMDGLATVKKLGYHPLVNAVMVKKDGSTCRVDIASTLRKGTGGESDATITVGRLSDSYRMVNYLQDAARATNKIPRKR